MAHRNTDHDAIGATAKRVREVSCARIADPGTRVAP